VRLRVALQADPERLQQLEDQMAGEISQAVEAMFASISQEAA
jgi:hypothetical protein